MVRHLSWRNLARGLVIACFMWCCRPADTVLAEVVFSGGGLAASGRTVNAMAALSIAGDDLTITLENTSP